MGYKWHIHGIYMLYQPGIDGISMEYQWEINGIHVIPILNSPCHRKWCFTCFTQFFWYFLQGFLGLFGSFGYFGGPIFLFWKNEESTSKIQDEYIGTSGSHIALGYIGYRGRCLTLMTSGGFRSYHMIWSIKQCCLMMRMVMIVMIVVSYCFVAMFFVSALHLFCNFRRHRYSLQ